MTKLIRFRTLRSSLVAGCIFLLLLILAACDQETPTPTPELTEETAVSEADESEIPEEPTATPTDVPTDTPEPPTPTPVPPTPTATPALSSAPGYEPVFEDADCAFAVPAGRDVSCGYLTVPENRATVDNGRTVRLHVAIFASESDNPEPDPIVYLEGGPGGDALEAVPLVFEQRFAPFTENRDFIMFDQRGTGYSEPSLACPESIERSLELLDDDLSNEEAQAVQLETLSTCRERLLADGVDLTAYNSAESAADLNDLRLALGYDDWNVYGISYGTRLAQTAVRDYPEGIRSIVLDSAYPLAANLQTEAVSNADRAFKVFFEGCAADENCQAAYPDLEGEFLALVEELNDNPIFVNVFYVHNGQTYETLVNGDALIGVLFQSLYQATIIPQLPRIIFEVRDGDTMNLTNLLSSFLANNEYVSQGMQVSVQCHEEIVFTEPGEFGAAPNYPLLEDYFRPSGVTGEFGSELCELWQAGAADAVENEPVSSDIPTLILAGEYDPITPPGWGQAVAEGFSQSTFVEFPGLGHGSSISGDCPLAMTKAFLDAPTEPVNDSCVAEMTPPDFFVPGGVADTAVELEPFTNDTFGITGVKPGGWTEAAPGTYARGSDALDQTVLIQQAIPPGMGAAAILDLLSAQLGLEETPASAGTIEDSNGRSWELFQTEFQGFQLDIHFNESDSGVLLVMLISDPEERDALYENVLLPTLDSLDWQ